MNTKPKKTGNSIVDVLIRRDEMKPDEAWGYFRECQEEFMQLLESGEVDDLDEYMIEYFGLEPDYAVEFLLG